MGVVIKATKWILAIALAVVFVGAGLVKLTDKVNPDVYAHMVKEFKGYGSIPPFNSFGWSAETNRVLIGAIEVFFGMLVLCPYYTRLSAFIFMTLMGGGVWTLFSLQQPFIAPAAFLAASTLLFLVSGDSVASGKAVASQNKKKQ